MTQPPRPSELTELTEAVRALTARITRSRKQIIIFGIIFVILLGVGGYAVVQASRAVACGNAALRDRDPAAAMDQTAHRVFSSAQQSFASASKSWADALHNVLNKRSASPAQLKAYGAFTTQTTVFDGAAAVYAKAAVAYRDTLAADQQIRNEHPLGRCA